MLEAIPENIRLVVIIVGLTLLFILAVSLVHKHEQHMAERRIAAQRMGRAVEEITYVLDQVRAGSLPAGLGQWLRKEVLARYMTIRALWSKYPRIDALQLQAKEQVAAEPEGTASPLPPIMEGEAELNLYTSGINSLIQLLQRSDIGGALEGDVQREYCLQLVCLQVETVSRYHTESSIAAAKEDDWTGAIKQARSLDLYLMNKRQITQRCDDIYKRAKSMLKMVEQHEIPNVSELDG